MRVLQITDTHLRGDPTRTLNGFNPRDRYDRVRAYLQTSAPPPQLVLVTGDLGHGEGRVVYEPLRADLETLGCPALVIPGNHDVPDEFAEAFPATGRVSGRFEYEDGGWRFLMLNSQIPGAVPGRLGPDRIERLGTALAAAPDTPTLVALHHPVVPVGTPWLDEHRIEDATELLECLREHEQVKLLLCAHVHHATDIEIRPGLRQLTGPSTAMPFRAGSTGFTVDDEPPGIRWLHLEPDGSFDTEVEYID